MIKDQESHIYNDSLKIGLLSMLSKLTHCHLQIGLSMQDYFKNNFDRTDMDRKRLPAANRQIRGERRIGLHLIHGKKHI